MADISKDTIDAATARVAELLRGAYCRLMARTRHMDSYTPGAKYDVHFKRAAVTCVQRGIDPCKFVEVLFRDVKPYPYIQMLGSKSAIDRYTEAADDIAKSMRESYEVQVNVFKSSVQRIGIIKTISEGKFGMNTLFVYLAACANGLRHEVEDMEAAALAEYLTSCYYDEIYGVWIPEGFIRARLQLQTKDVTNDGTDSGE